MRSTIPYAIVTVLAALAVGTAAYVRFGDDRTPVSPFPDDGYGRACTMEAKICPDGSAVGRTSPNCSFAPCPGDYNDPDTSGILDQTDLVRVTDEPVGTTFEYPSTLSTVYVAISDGRPVLTVIESPYECSTVPHTIDGTAYCVTARSEGAAGSVYTSYTYVTKGADTANDRSVKLEFTLKRVRCTNYDEPKQSECRTEQDSFNVDALAHAILETVSFD